MRYQSTRGGLEEVTFEEALFMGHCSDGGLLVPSRIPSIDMVTLRSMSQMSYKELVKYIARLYIAEAEIPTADLEDIIDKAFSRFTHPDVVKMAKLPGGLNILELFHGATLVFKDLALSCVGQLLSYFLNKRKKHVTVVVATSGDTGSAAAESVRGLPWLDIIVLWPKGRCSRVQELQITTILDDNVHVFQANGASDDFDQVINRCFQDIDFVKKHNLFSINSSNWARVMIQTAHFFYAYFQVCSKVGDEVEIVVPTGGMGNIKAACFAREMGLPIKLVCAVNVNDVVARTVTKGDLSRPQTGLQKTWASAMDTQMPVNIERVLYLFSGGNAKLLKEQMEMLERDSKITIPDGILDKMQQAISSHTVKSNAAIGEVMQRCWRENQYLVCPHTAVGVSYHYARTDASGHGEDSLPRVCLATASPAKFEEVVLSAGLTVPPTDLEGVKALDGKPTRYVDIEKYEDLEAILRAKIEDISEKSKGQI